MNNYDIAQYILEAGGCLWGGYVRDFIAGVKPEGDIDVYISDYHCFNPDKFAKILLDKGISSQKVEQPVKEEPKIEAPMVEPRASYSNFLNMIDHLEPPHLSAQTDDELYFEQKAQIQKELERKRLSTFGEEGLLNPCREILLPHDKPIQYRICGYSGIPWTNVPLSARDSNDDFLFHESLRYQKISKSGEFQRFLVGEKQIQVDFCYAPIIELDFTVHALTMFLNGAKELVFGTLDRYENKGSILTLMKHIRDRVLIPASVPMSSVPQFRIDKMVSKGYKLL